MARVEIQVAQNEKWFVLMQIVCTEWIIHNYPSILASPAHPHQQDVVNRQKIRLKWCVKSWKWISMLHLSTITPSFTRVLLGVFFFSSSNISQSRLETFLVLPSFFREERIKDFVTKKRFSLLLERRRITWRLTACLIVNRGTGVLTANALNCKPAENTRNMESLFFY